MPDLDADTIAEIATDPASASQDGRSASSHPLKDIQAIADKQAANTAIGSGSAWNRLRKARAIPGGGGPE